MQQSRDQHGSKRYSDDLINLVCDYCSCKFGESSACKLLCHDYMRNVACAYGDSCHYVHGSKKGREVIIMLNRAQSPFKKEHSTGELHVVTLLSDVTDDTRFVLVSLDKETQEDILKEDYNLHHCKSMHSGEMRLRVAVENVQVGKV